MSVRVMPGTAARNGLPDFRSYEYGASRPELRPVIGKERADSIRKGQPGLPGRALAALEALGGEASTPEIRTALELDGGPPFSPPYLVQLLTRLSRREPPAVTPSGRESDGSGRPRRWQLGPGAGEPVPDLRTQPAGRPAAAANPRCRRCKYLKASPGHEAACGGGS